MEYGRFLLDDLNVSTSYDDIIGQYLDEHFPPYRGSVPIEKYPELTLPTSYTSYTKEILKTINPQNLSSRGTGIMIAQVFCDSLTGGNLDISESNLHPLTKTRITQAILTSMVYGTSFKVLNGEDIEIKTTAEAYYDKTNNIIYTATPVIINDKDTTIYEERRIDNGFLVIVSKHTLEGDEYITTKYLEPYDDKHNKPSSLGVQIFSNNEYNDDWVGQSIFHEVIPQIQILEITMHEYTKAMLYTKPRLFILSDAIERDDDGQETIDLVTDVYTAIDGNAIEDPKKLVESSQFEFNAEAFSIKIGDELASILSKVGMDRKTLAWSGSNIEKSATEVQSEDNRMFTRFEKYREFYTPQMIEAIKLINLGTEDIQIRFLPLQYMSFTSNVNNVVALANSGMISKEKGVRILYARESDEQIKEEVIRIKEQSITNGTDVLGILNQTDTNIITPRSISDDIG